MAERKRKMDFEYTFDAPPFEMVEFNVMTKKQARQHYEWFIGRIPSRLKILTEAFLSTGGIGDGLDETPESLLRLWAWARHHFTGRLPREMDYKRGREIGQEFLKTVQAKGGMVSKEQSLATLQSFGPKGPLLSPFDKVLCLDIAYYFGQTVIRLNSAVQWGMMTRTTERNRPMLFLAYPDGWIEPWAMTEVCAIHHIRGEGSDDHLRKAFDNQVRNIPLYEKMRNEKEAKKIFKKNMGCSPS
jgi:hypothetical protein